MNAHATSSASPTPPHASGEPSVLGEYGGFDVYPMPVWTSIAAGDVERTVGFLVDVLHFAVMYTGPEVGGSPMLVHLRGRRYQDILVTRRTGDPQETARTGGLQICFASDDADALAERARAAGADVEGPVDRPWGAREVVCMDPDGNRLLFSGFVGGPPTGSIDDAMERVASEQRR